MEENLLNFGGPKPTSVIELFIVDLNAVANMK